MWLSRCSTRTLDKSAFVQPSPPSHFDTGSSKRILPCSTNRAVTTAVNILFIEPRLNFVSRRLGTPSLRLAMPRAAS